MRKENKPAAALRDSRRRGAIVARALRDVRETLAADDAWQGSDTLASIDYALKQYRKVKK